MRIRHDREREGGCGDIRKDRRIDEVNVVPPVQPAHPIRFQATSNIAVGKGGSEVVTLRCARDGGHGEYGPQVQCRRGAEEGGGQFANILGQPELGVRSTVSSGRPPSAPERAVTFTPGDAQEGT